MHKDNHVQTLRHQVLCHAKLEIVAVIGSNSILRVSTRLRRRMVGVGSGHQFGFLRRSMYFDSKKTAPAIAPRTASATNLGILMFRTKIGTRKSAMRAAVSEPYCSAPR